MTLFNATQIVRGNTKGCWSVCLYHKDSKRNYWLDAGLDEQYHDVEVEWNQYIFYLADPEDIDRKEFQENCDNFEAACEAVYAVLESEGEIFHGEDGDWYLKDGGEGWTTRSWNV